MNECKHKTSCVTNASDRDSLLVLSVIGLHKVCRFYLVFDVSLSKSALCLRAYFATRSGGSHGSTLRHDRADHGGHRTARYRHGLQLFSRRMKDGASLRMLGNVTLIHPVVDTEWALTVGLTHSAMPPKTKGLMTPAPRVETKAVQRFGVGRHVTHIFRGWPDAESVRTTLRISHGGFRQPQRT